MSRMKSWGIDLTDLEDQIEDAMDAERRAGYEDGYYEGLSHREEPADLVGLNKWDELMQHAQDNHKTHMHHNFPMRQCSNPLCRALSEMDEEVNP